MRPTAATRASAKQARNYTDPSNRRKVYMVAMVMQTQVESQGFVAENASALFGLIGVVAGLVAGHLSGWYLRKREFNLRAWERVLDKRIEAHEGLIAVAREMYTMTATGGFGDDGEVPRIPMVLLTREGFEEWMASAIGRLIGPSVWLSTHAIREAYFTQDYLVTFHTHLQNAESALYPPVGAIVRQDFIDVAGELQRVAQTFFDKDLLRLKLRDPRAHHKYPRPETERRLQSTALLSRWQEIASIVGADET